MTINEVKGIVFQTSPTVKIVSTDEVVLKWGEHGTTTNATDKDNGKTNMAKIKSIPDWQSKYPAFKWCADLGDGWYLPSINELKAIYSQKDRINQTLTTNKMKELGSASTLFCSSSEGASLNILIGIHFLGGSTFWNYKDRDHAVRAVYEIK